ncbi:efflux RND transporter periplasmic adaptor subunit [Parachitinimonas caeni]|uniref:Efflux RND transporter periplasmic adaptor subunit n=1 Tax=Parachitinimonas caeni TaxID=3031301 RepID=A0ABT7DWY1_9NEIS|nr:efflux RND transporter periplasmic adaptor subunit [Parachitinimonas caeni]MDK2124573.1 efflux RND transporter periplasmic adaptor subunit [Parachitinimonas caeni]
MPSKKSIIIIVGLAAAVAAGFAWKDRQPKAADAGPERAGKGDSRPTPVTALIVAKRDIPMRHEFSGTVVSANQVDLRAQVAGTVAAIKVAEGASVAKGDLLVVLDDRADAAMLQKLDAQIARTRAQLADAQRALNRSRELVAQGFVSKSATDTAESNASALTAALAADQAALAAARVESGYRRIVAPMSGRVGAIAVRPGSLVQPSGAPLLTLTQFNPIEVSFSVPERLLSQLITARQADAVEVRLSVAGKPMAGKLSFVDTTVDAASGAIKAKATFANPQDLLWPGAQLQVEVTLGTLKDAIAVPAQAVMNGPNGSFVYQIGDDASAKPLPVRLLRLGEGLAVVEGISPGTKVVVEGGPNLRPGAKVQEAKPGDGPAGKSERKHKKADA